MTNGDRIRQMRDEELAKILNGMKNACDYCIGKYKRFDEFDCPIIVNEMYCISGIKAYLESECE